MQDTLLFNQVEYNDAIEREEAVLNEQFISAAFENQGLIADLYESTGTKGFDKVSQQLGLLKQEDLIESQKQKQAETQKLKVKQQKIQAEKQNMESQQTKIYKYIFRIYENDETSECGGV